MRSRSSASAVRARRRSLLMRKAAAVWKEQGLPANLVLTTSANAVVAKKGSLAYDASKAAANHLVRELAVELAPLVRVNGVAPATVVQGSSMFPRDRVIASLRDHAVDQLVQFFNALVDALHQGQWQLLDLLREGKERKRQKSHESVHRVRDLLHVGIRLYVEVEEALTDNAKRKGQHLIAHV